MAAAGLGEQVFEAARAGQSRAAPLKDVCKPEDVSQLVDELHRGRIW